MTVPTFKQLRFSLTAVNIWDFINKILIQYLEFSIITLKGFKVSDLKIKLILLLWTANCSRKTKKFSKITLALYLFGTSLSICVICVYSMKYRQAHFYSFVKRWFIWIFGRSQPNHMRVLDSKAFRKVQNSHNNHFFHISHKKGGNIHL